MLKLDPCLEIAKSAALLAGAYIKDQQIKDLEILFNDGRDIKLQIDIDAEWAEAQHHPDPDTALDHIYSDSPFPKEKEYKSISKQIVIVLSLIHI